AVALTTVGANPMFPASDGADIWVPGGGLMSRVRASDGKLLEQWSGANSANSTVVAMGRVFATGFTSPGSLYRIDPSQAAGSVTTVWGGVGVFPEGLAFAGGRLWAATSGPPAGVSIVTPAASIPWTVTTVTAGFTIAVTGVVFDGANIWVTEGGSPGKLRKLDANGGILMTVTGGDSPPYPPLDGSDIWGAPPDPNTATARRAPTRAIPPG